VPESDDIQDFFAGPAAGELHQQDQIAIHESNFATKGAEVCKSRASPGDLPAHIEIAGQIEVLKFPRLLRM
jgi:hypothetical protein